MSAFLLRTGTAGRTPVAGMVHAATLLTVMLVAAPLAMNVPGWPRSARM